LLLIVDLAEIENRSLHRLSEAMRWFRRAEVAMQRTVLYLGEITTTTSGWRKSLSVLMNSTKYANLSLFLTTASSRDAVDSLQVKMSGLELRRPRRFGSCWLACELWQQLGLQDFGMLALRIAEDVSWEKVLQLLVVNRLLIQEASFACIAKDLTTAMDALLERTSPWPRRTACIVVWTACWNTRGTLSMAAQKWADLFQADSKCCSTTDEHVLEGAMEENPKPSTVTAGQRTDCLQVVIALVITTDGFPLAYEVMDGNTSDRTTLRGF